MSLKGKKLSEEHKRKISNSKNGHKHSNETKKKISKAMKNHKCSEETRNKIGKANKGKKRSEEAKRKISKANKGRICSEETKIKLSNILKGRIISKKTRKKMSDSCKDRKKMSEETRNKISNALKGKKRSEEHKNNIRKSLKGKKRSKEIRNKMSLLAIQRIKENPRIADCYGHQGYFYSKKNKKEIHYRSSYELTAYNILEQLSKVKNYEVEPFSIKYNCFGKFHRTLPDLLVTYTNGTRELIEVKSEYKLKGKIETLKFLAMEDYCRNNNLEFSIWTEKELFGK